MRAVCYQGKFTVQVETVKDPEILNPRDAIIKVTSTSICGSDLHLYHGLIPGVEAGDILGHEFMGIVVDVGPGVKNVRPGDRVVVPFNIACGNCCPCARQEFSLCDNSNPNSFMLEKLNGQQRGIVWLFASLRWLCRRTGRIRARSLCGCRADQN